MIKEVITEIIDAEAKADTILAVANQKAKDISLSLHAESEELKSVYAARVKEGTKAILAEAECAAAKNAHENIKQSEINADRMVKACDKNILKTVEWLAELLVKQNS